MPRTEARIFTSIWRDPAFTSLPVDAQWLYEFLLSQDDLTYCGVLPLRPARWCKAADMTVGRIADALKWLEGRAYPTAYPFPESAPTPLIIVDEDAGEVFIRALMRRDGIWKMPNIFRLAIEAAAQVESLRIRGAMLTEMRRLPLDETGSEQVKTLVAGFIADLEKGGPYPSPYPTQDPADYPPDEGSGNPPEKGHACARGIRGSVTVDGDSPDPLFPVAPNSSMPAQARKRATRLPDGFAPDADLLAWAAEKAPHVDPARETERFCDYWRAKAGRDGAKHDWPATWRNWMRTAEDRQGPRDRPGNRRQQETDEMFEDAARRIAARKGTTP